MNFPRIIKVKDMPENIKEQLNEDSKIWKNVYDSDDLVIVTVTVTYSSGKPSSFGFEKIEGDPITYLLERCEKYRKENGDLIHSLPEA